MLHTWPEINWKWSNQFLYRHNILLHRIHLNRNVASSAQVNPLFHRTFFVPSIDGRVSSRGPWISESRLCGNGPEYYHLWRRHFRIQYVHVADQLQSFALPDARQKQDVVKTHQMQYISSHSLPAAQWLTRALCHRMVWLPALKLEERNLMLLKEKRAPGRARRHGEVEKVSFRPVLIGKMNTAPHLE